MPTTASRTRFEVLRGGRPSRSGSARRLRHEIHDALRFARAEPTPPFVRRIRPQAIDAALDGLGDPRTLTIADVGAGTGISARLFAERGARVIAIEPNAQMRAAAEAHPRVDVARRHGRADAVLQSASVDAVVACQAFHWFATIEACTEFRRIARRRAVLLQYERDERDPFTKSLR